MFFSLVAIVLVASTMVLADTTPSKASRPRNLRTNPKFVSATAQLAWNDENFHGEMLGATPAMTRKRQSLPRTTDWTSYSKQLGAPINQVRHQGSTGSCWVHSALGAVEANNNLLNLIQKGTNAEPFFLDFSNALNCMQMRNEFTGATPYLPTHPAEFEIDIQCALPAPVVTAGRCGVTAAYQQLGTEMNKFGEQYGVWLEVQLYLPEENIWRLGSGLATLADWGSVPGSESFEGRRDAAFTHFINAYSLVFRKSIEAADCQIMSALPYRAIGDGGLEPRTFDFLAEQQRCLRHASDSGEVDGECFQGQDGPEAYAPTNSDEVREFSDDEFSASRCTLSPAGDVVNAFSRFWTLAATWDKSQDLPNVNGFVSQRPYWQSYGPLDIYTQGSAAVQKALLSMMATVDHGPTTGVIQTCNGFMDYKAAAHGKPIWFPNCDVMEAPKADECDPSENGLHAIVVVGYKFAGFNRPLEESYFEIVNSYGLEWGVQGHARLAMGHFMLSQFTLPLIRHPQRLDNPLLPKIDPAIAYSLPPTLFVRESSGLDVTTSNGLAVFPFNGDPLTLSVEKKLPDVAINSVTVVFNAAVPALDSATLDITFTATPANRMMLPGETATTYRIANTNSIVFTVPPTAASVPASSWWQDVTIAIKSSRTPQMAVVRITYTIDAAKSGAFLSDDTLKTDPPNSAAALTASAAALATVAAAML